MDKWKLKKRLKMLPVIGLLCGLFAVGLWYFLTGRLNSVNTATVVAAIVWVVATTISLFVVDPDL